MTLGQSISEARKSAGLTQGELGKRTGFSVPYLSDVERDRTHPSLKALLKLSRALKVTPGFLLDRVTRWAENI